MQMMKEIDDGSGKLPITDLLDTPVKLEDFIYEIFFLEKSYKRCEGIT